MQPNQSVSRILIVDDEQIARQRMRRFLTEVLPSVEVEEAEDGPEALEKLRTFGPQLLLLDIQMPEMTGFDVLAQLEKREFKLVFATAYQEYAIRAFEENACDYLLKPFSKERFAEAIKRAVMAFQAEHSLTRLQKSLQKEGVFLSRLALKVGSRTDLVDAIDIDCLIANDDLITISTEHDEYISDISLNHFEQQLDPELFFRCHRNAIVNLSQVTSLKEGAETLAILKSGRTIAVSRRRKSDLHAKLGKKKAFI